MKHVLKSVLCNFDDFSSHSHTLIFKKFLVLRANHGCLSRDSNLSKSPSLATSNVGLSG